MKLYEYAIILQPKEDKDGEIVEVGEVLAQGSLLAHSQDEVQVRVARMIPEAHIGHLDRVDVAIRPF